MGALVQQSVLIFNIDVGAAGMQVRGQSCLDCAPLLSHLWSSTNQSNIHQMFFHTNKHRSFDRNYLLTHFLQPAKNVGNKLLHYKTIKCSMCCEDKLLSFDLVQIPHHFFFLPYKTNLLINPIQQHTLTPQTHWHRR